MPFSIDEISDRLEINDLYTRYVHAADDRDFIVLDDIFLPTSTFDWSSCGGGKLTYEEAKKGPIFKGTLFPWSFHIYTNAKIEFVDGRDAAVAKVKAFNPSGLRNVDGKAVMYQTHGAYVDRLEKTAIGWHIVDRVWHEAFILGPLQRIEGMSGMLEAAGVQSG